MGENKSIWYKMGNLDYRIVYAVFILMLSIPIFYPLGIPMSITSPVQNYYNVINDLPPGSAVLFHEWIDLSIWADMGPIIIATLKMVWDIPQEKDIKIIFYCSSSDGAIKINDLFLGECAPPQWRVDTYSESWVDLGYISLPNEPVMATFAADVAEVQPLEMHDYPIGAEWKRTPIYDVPIVQEIAARCGDPNKLDFYDFDLYIFGSWTCTAPDQWVRQFWTTGSPPYELPMIMMTIGNCVPNVMPYYGATKPIKGYVPGAGGAAQLELLTDNLGEGIVMADIGDLAGLATLLFLVLGNLSLLGEKYFGKKEE